MIGSADLQSNLRGKREFVALKQPPGSVLKDAVGGCVHQIGHPVL